MVIRSVVAGCLKQTAPTTGPSLRRISSNALGQSSSVPSSSPIKCLASVKGNSRREHREQNAAGDGLVCRLICIPAQARDGWLAHYGHGLLGSGSRGGVRKCGGPSRSSASRGSSAAASRLVSGGRFHLRSISLSIDVWS